MARLSFPENAWSEGIWTRFVQSVRKGIESYDFDSGWIATPSNKVIQHKLGVLPKTVLVYASNNTNGDPFSLDTFTVCTSDSVTITGPLAFCRVLIDA